VLSLRGLSCLAFALCGAFSAQAERLPFRPFTTAEGLAGDAVQELLQDSRGFLWIATSSGLSRFDGQIFRNYDTPDGLPSPRVNAFVETRDGTLWIGTTEGLVRLDPLPAAGHPLFVTEPLPPGMASAGVNCFLEDHAGRLWVGWGEGLVVFDQPSRRSLHGRRVDLPAVVDNVSALAEDAEGTLWAATLRGLVRIVSDGRRILYPLRPPEDSIGDLAFDRDGHLWLTSGAGLYVFRPEPLDHLPTSPIIPLALRARSPRTPGEMPELPGEVIHFDHRTGLADDFVYTVVPGHSSGMWVGTRGGVTRFDQGPPRHIRPAQGLPEAPVLSVLEDSEGTLWLGTESRGLARLTRSGFVAFGNEDGLTGDRVSGMFEDPAGGLYVVIWSRDLHYFDGRRFQTLTPRVMAGHFGWGWNQFFLRDHGGRWWVPTSQGLFRFAPVAKPEDLREARPEAVYTQGNGLLPGNDVFRLYEDRAGDVWVSLIAVPPLVRLVGGGRPVRVPEARGDVRLSAPTVFAEDDAGDLWVGFYSGGLARLRRGQWQTFGARDGVPPGFVSDLHYDRAGRLWVATTSGGVARVDDPAADPPRFPPPARRSAVPVAPPQVAPSASQSPAAEPQSAAPALDCVPTHSWSRPASPILHSQPDRGIRAYTRGAANTPLPCSAQADRADKAQIPGG